MLSHFTPKLKWGDTCLAISGSHLNWPNTGVKIRGAWPFRCTGSPCLSLSHGGPADDTCASLRSLQPGPRSGRGAALTSVRLVRCPRDAPGTQQLLMFPLTGEDGERRGGGRRENTRVAEAVGGTSQTAKTRLRPFQVPGMKSARNNFFFKQLQTT